MSILVPLLMALAAPHPNDRLFDAPAEISAVRPLDGQPLWVVMSRCAKARYDDAERLGNSQFTALDKTMADSYGMTVEERRAQEMDEHETVVKRYLAIAIQSVADDRGIEIEDANAFVLEQFPQAEPLRITFSGATGFATDACPFIADLVEPA